MERDHCICMLDNVHDVLANTIEHILRRKDSVSCIWSSFRLTGMIYIYMCTGVGVDHVQFVDCVQ